MKRFLLALVAFVALAGPLRAEIAIQDVTSPGGINAWLVEEHSIPFVALELRFKGGASLDAPDKRGAINLMTALLEEGAGDMDAEGFTVETERLAANFRFDADADSVAISARVLTENRDEALALLRQALLAPRFDPDAIERVRGQVLARINANALDPEDTSYRTFSALAFGDHPYGSAVEGTEESVTALTRDDLVDAKDRVMARDRLYVSAVGDIDAATLAGLLDDLLGDLPAEGAPMPPKAQPALAGGVTVVEFDTPQSAITFGQRGLPMTDPDFFPAFVLTQILGGHGFSSRLMTEVREKRGLTYGIGANLYTMDLADLLLGSTATVNARAGETVAVVKDEWARLASEGVTEDELDRAKTYLTGEYPLRFDGNGRIAGILVGMQTSDMPIDYARTRNDRIRAVTLADVNRVAAGLIDPAQLTFVVVGHPEGLDLGQ